MKEDKDFNVTVSLSKQGYNSKEEAISAVMNDRKKMAELGITESMRFKRTTLTVKGLLGYIMNGYTFCGLYKYKEGKKVFIQTCSGKQYYTMPTEKDGYMKRCVKRSDYWEGSQTVSIDIDETAYQHIPAFLSMLSCQPTFTYTTFSDKPEKRKFRMVYVMDKILARNEHKAVSEALHNQIEKETGEKIQDRCGTRTNQYFNGTTQKGEAYISGCVYELNDIRGYYDELLELIAEEEEDNKITLDKQFVGDLKLLSYNQVVAKYSKVYEYYYRTQVEFKEGEKYRLVSERHGYYQLYFRWENEEPVKYVDGEHRRAKMGNYCRLRRLIKNDTSPDELLYNLYIDRERFFDNSDDTLSIECLVSIVKKTMKKELDVLQTEYEESREAVRKAMKDDYHEKKLVVNPKYYGKYERSKMMADIRTGTKEWNYFLIDEYYNPDLTVQDNLDSLKKNGVEVSDDTLYRYCKDRGIVYKLTDDDLRKLINPSLSVRKNLENIKGQGYKVGSKKVQKLLKEIKNRQP